MKRNQLYLICCIAVTILFSCKNEVPVKEKETKKKGRNMFGHNISRGLTKTSENLAEGYIMYAVTNSSSVYLLNREGKVVHKWKSNYRVETPYLNNDGSLFLQVADPDFPVFAGGGEAGRLQKISWDSKIVWDFEYANEEHCAHHDIAVMPNGNVLTIAWEAKTAEDVLKSGRKPELIPKAGLWPSTIVEIEPNGKRGGTVVWDWHIWDHLIQDYDAEKDNYGDVAAHPELLDFNLSKPLPEPISQDSMDILHALKKPWRNVTIDNRGSDVYHLNAVNYDEELDQIVFSSPKLNEIFIIDHSTTPEEARGHSGGKYGKGGDFLYRWGNPQNYRQGDSTDQKLYGQHDIRWIEKGKPGEGNLLVFNNDIPMGPDSLDYSAIYEFSPIVNSKGEYTRMEDNSYGPKDAVWQYIAPDTLSFFGSFVSGAQRMQNGNTFINEGPKGRFFEVTPKGEIVWEYLNPYRGNIHHTDGDPVSPMPMTHMIFRANFIPKDHPGLAGKDLIPLDPQPKEFTLPPKPEAKK